VGGPQSFVEQHPREWQALRGLEGKISEEAMLDMMRRPTSTRWASSNRGAVPGLRDADLGEFVQRHHAPNARALVAGGRVAVVFGAGGHSLGVAAVRFHAAGQAILLSSALVQTIPSLALLCFLIPVFGVGTKPRSRRCACTVCCPWF